MPQLMIYRVWCLDNSRRSTPWKVLVRRVSRGMTVVVRLVCSIWTNTADLYVVPRLSSLVLGSFYRRTFPLFSFEWYPNHFSPWFVRSRFIVFYVILCVCLCGLPLPFRGQINNQSITWHGLCGTWPWEASGVILDCITGVSCTKDLGATFIQWSADIW